MNRSCLRRCLLTAFAATAVLSPALPLLAGPAHAGSSTVPTAPDTSTITPVRIGDITLVDAVSRGVVLQNGGSGTEFSVDLPKDAACPGDSENDNWRVQTFLIPAADDPGAIVYDANGPTGTNQWAIYDANTNSVVNLLTTPNGKPGLPGNIEQFLSLSFEVFTTDLLAPGSYRIGIACTWFGATGSYWDTEIEMIAAAADQPGGFTWRLPDAPPSTLSGTKEPSSLPLTWIFLAIAAAALAVVVVLNRRSSRTSH